MTLAAAQSVRKTFGAVVAVDDVDLHVDPGEVVGLLGANGAGKTTLVRMLLGLLAPTAGRVELFGQEPSRPTRKRIGYVPQGLGLYDDLTVAENLAFTAAAFGVAPSTPGDLTSVGSILVRDLPVGHRRRVAFAAALQHTPDLLVLDEPTSGVDVLARADLWDTIRETVEAGVGVLVTTHHMEEAEECDRLVMMAAGRVAARGRVEDLVRGSTAVVHATDWTEAFVALDATGLTVALVGRTLRVPRADAHSVEEALRSRGVDAQVDTEAMTLEETFAAMVAGDS